MMKILNPIYIEMIKEDPGLQLKIVRLTDMPTKLIAELADETPEYYSLPGLSRVIHKHYNEFLKPEDRISYANMFIEVEDTVSIKDF